MSNSGLFSIASFKNRGIIKLAPDALVYINGNLGTTILTPVTNSDGKLSFNDGITSINVTSSIEPAGSSTASIEITTPIYNENSNYWVIVPSGTKKTTWVPILIPMMEVRILLKGRYLVGGIPRYYPVFWGLITSVDESYNSGNWKITVNCGDMLTWWRHSVLNKKPGIDVLTVDGIDMSPELFGSIFGQSNPYEVLYALSTQLGQAEFIIPTAWAQATDANEIYPNYKYMSESAMSYWKSRFGTLGSMLKMFGARGEEVVVRKQGKNGFKTFVKVAPIGNIQYSALGNEISKARNAATTNPFVTYDLLPQIAGYPSGNALDRISMDTPSTYQSKLEYAVELTQKIDFEFYQDVNGDLIFKPPFYNVNTSTIEPYVVRSNDIIGCNFTTDSEALITCLRVYSVFSMQQQDVQVGKSIGMHYDIDLIARYGLRYQEVCLEYLESGDSNKARIYAMSRMSCINAKATSGTITIPGRPELKLGYPIYIDHRDSFHYVRSITHSFDFGGSFTTTIGIEAERTRQYNYVDGQDPVPLKNMVYSLLSSDTSANQTVISPENNVIKSTGDALRASQNRISSLEQGRYIIEPMSHGDQISATSKSVPYTDEEGYRVIGAFPYGRGLVVPQDGVITDAQDPKNQATNAAQNKKSDSITMGSVTESTLLADYFGSSVDKSVAGIVNQYYDLDKSPLINISENERYRGITQATPDTKGTSKSNVSSPLVADASKVPASIEPSEKTQLKSLPWNYFSEQAKIKPTPISKTPPVVPVKNSPTKLDQLNKWKAIQSKKRNP